MRDEPAAEPKHTHAWDQAKAGMMEMAVALGAYRAELGRLGFTREEALAICIAWQTSALAHRPTA